MFEMKFDFSDFEKMADRIGGLRDQLPYVMSTLLNDSAFKARQAIIEAWPTHVVQRNPNFIRAALRVDKAGKSNLTVSVYDQLGRGNLALHDHGGTAHPLRARQFAIPISPSIRRTSRGVSKSQSPAAIIARTPKRALRVIPGKGIFVGKNGKLELIYAFKSAVQLKKDVPFAEDFRFVMLNNLRTGFADMMRKAMSTRRR